MERSERNARDAVHVIASQERQGDDEKMIARHSVAVVLLLLLRCVCCRCVLALRG